MRISYEGREYVYSTEGLGRAMVLEREGVRVTMESGQYVPAAGTPRAGTATGPADAVDLLGTVTPLPRAAPAARAAGIALTAYRPRGSTVQ
ncbi:hypothetical protein [Streptomyces sp. NBC_00280]|uniref:hypothetical protein n=1 Tax=Streptomyces sp. NBC_00280 TaxID=2975699 RepID=UPI00324F6B51